MRLHATNLRALRFAHAQKDLSKLGAFRVALLDCALQAKLNRRIRKVAIVKHDMKRSPCDVRFMVRSETVAHFWNRRLRACHDQLRIARDELDRHNEVDCAFFWIVSAAHLVRNFVEFLICRMNQESACRFDACRFRASHDISRIFAHACEAIR